MATLQGETVCSADDISALQNNRIIGKPSLKNSKVIFKGSGNVLYCEAGVRLQNCTFCFDSSNSLIYICKSIHSFKLLINVFQGCTVYIGKNFYSTETAHLLVPEQGTILLGDDCMLASKVVIRATDSHLIYSVESHKRVNPGKSIFIGDHVWLGYDTLCLKGTQIGSGSIIGARAVVAGKRIPSNTSWAGNPAKQIATGIFFDRTLVYPFEKADVKSHANHPGDEFIYCCDEHTLSFDSIDKKLRKCKSVDERLNYLHTIRANHNHNRFSVSPPPAKKQQFIAVLAA